MRAVRSGFTLVELVLAVVITSVAVYALLVVFSTAVYKHVDLEYLSMGLSLANGKLEEVSSRKYSSITGETSAPFGSDFSDFNCAVEFNYVSTEALDVPVGTDYGYKRITVRVTSSNLPSSIEVSTLVTDVSNE